MLQFSREEQKERKKKESKRQFGSDMNVATTAID